MKVKFAESEFKPIAIVLESQIELEELRNFLSIHHLARTPFLKELCSALNSLAF
jgi:hypothetical protein